MMRKIWMIGVCWLALCGAGWGELFGQEEEPVLAVPGSEEYDESFETGAGISALPPAVQYPSWLYLTSEERDLLNLPIDYFADNEYYFAFSHDLYNITSFTYDQIDSIFENICKIITINSFLYNYNTFKFTGLKLSTIDLQNINSYESNNRKILQLFHAHYKNKLIWDWYKIENRIDTNIISNNVICQSFLVDHHNSVANTYRNVCYLTKNDSIQFFYLYKNIPLDHFQKVLNKNIKINSSIVFYLATNCYNFVYPEVSTIDSTIIFFKNKNWKMHDSTYIESFISSNFLFHLEKDLINLIKLDKKLLNLFYSHESRLLGVAKNNNSLDSLNISETEIIFDKYINMANPYQNNLELDWKWDHKRVINYLTSILYFRYYTYCRFYGSSMNQESSVNLDFLKNLTNLINFNNNITNIDIIWKKNTISTRGVKNTVNTLLENLGNNKNLIRQINKSKKSLEIYCALATILNDNKFIIKNIYEVYENYPPIEAALGLSQISFLMQIDNTDRLNFMDIAFDLIKNIKNKKSYFVIGDFLDAIISENIYNNKYDRVEELVTYAYNNKDQLLLNNPGFENANKYYNSIYLVIKNTNMQLEEKADSLQVLAAERDAARLTAESKAQQAKKSEDEAKISEKETIQAKVNTEKLTIYVIAFGAITLLVAVALAIALLRNRRKSRQVEEQKQELDIQNQDLRAANLEKEERRRDLKHRTQNTLFILEKDLREQIDLVQPTDPEAAAELRVVLSRMMSVSLLYDLLDYKEVRKNIPLNSYLTDLAQTVREVMGQIGEGVLIEVSVPDWRISVDMEDAQRLGRVLNELLTNAIKHGFRQGEAVWQGEKKMVVTFTPQNELAQTTLVVANTGFPLPDGFDPMTYDENSQGMSILQTLVRDQYEGTVSAVSKENITTFVLTLPALRLKSSNAPDSP